MEKENFNPTEHLTQIKGKDYLEVKWRLVWFRKEHPDWSIQTHVEDRGDGWALMKAVIRDDNQRILATGYKSETKKGFPDYLEKAETGAIGRALALLGYGTQFAPELEEGERIVDSPVDTKASKNESDEPTSGDNSAGLCPSCKKGRLVLRKGAKGEFYGCSNYPNCKHTEELPNF